MTLATAFQIFQLVFMSEKLIQNEQFRMDKSNLTIKQGTGNWRSRQGKCSSPDGQCMLLEKDNLHKNIVSYKNQNKNNYENFTP